MNILVACLISFIIGGGAGFGAEWLVVKNAPPKTVIQNITTTQNVQTKTTAIQTADQSQSTIILQDAKTNFRYVVIGGNGTTNRKYYFSSKTNTSHKTNKN